MPCEHKFTYLLTLLIDISILVVNIGHIQALDNNWNKLTLRVKQDFRAGIKLQSKLKLIVKFQRRIVV